MTKANERSTKHVTPEPALPSRVLQRKCACGNETLGGAECAECNKGLQSLQRARRNGNDRKNVPPIVHEVLSSPGQPLESDTRTFFEGRFAHDFSQVRVHTDTRAGESAAAVDALTYTVGHDVVFGAGQYAPGTPKGNELLAHELTHVVQQPAVSGSPGGLTVGDPHSASEREAEQAATTLASGNERLTGLRARTGIPLVQRRADESISEDELQQYLKLLQTTGKIENHFLSSNKAQAIVSHWQHGDARYILPAQRKILLIKEMISAYTDRAAGEAILNLLRGATDAEFVKILREIGLDELQNNIDETQKAELNELVTQRHGAKHAGDARRADVYSGETALKGQRVFTANAELGEKRRKDCINIVRSMAPKLLTQDPKFAAQIRGSLAPLKGKTLTMPHVGKVLTELGAASALSPIYFNNRNGNASEAPTQMLRSAWDAILKVVGSTQGWHIFGVSVLDGYHSATVFVDNRADRPRVYWADQWEILPGEDFGHEPGSASGFRLYEQSGFDEFINFRTTKWWNEVHSPTSKCAEKYPKTWPSDCRYNATLQIWHFRSKN